MSLFIISKQDKDRLELTPRVPKNYLTEHGFEDNKTNRICACHTIEQCLMALSKNIKGQTYFVYKAVNPKNVYEPTQKEVPDVKITQEVWLLDKTMFSKVGKITVKDPATKHEYEYNHTKAYLYEWNFLLDFA